MSVRSFDPRIVLRPRTLDESLDLTLAYLREHRAELSKVFVACVLPAIAVLVALHYGLERKWAHTGAAALILAVLIERVVIAHTASHLFGNPRSAHSTLVTAFRRPLSALLAALLVPLPAIAAALATGEDPAWTVFASLGLMVWPFLLAHTIFHSIVLVLEQPTPFAAFRRATALGNIRFGRNLGFLALTLVARALFPLVAELSAKFVIGGVLQLGEPIDRLFEEGGSWPVVIAYLIGAPFVGVARLFEYVDARTRREGWDIQVRFKAIAGRDEAERARSLAA